MNKTKDRMPKEYKIAVYAIVIGTLYFLLYSLVLYGKFKHTSFFIFSLAISLVYGVLLIFLLLKSNFARILLGIISVIQSVLFFAVFIFLLFFSKTSVYFAKILHTGVFTFYLLIAQLGTTPDRGAIAAVLLTLWNAGVAYLLFHKETKRYTKEKTYELVDTRKETTVAVLIIFAVIAALYFLVRF